MATLSVVIMCMVVLYPLASVSWLSHQWRPWAVISCTASSFIWFHWHISILALSPLLAHSFIRTLECVQVEHTPTQHTHSPLLSRSGTFPTVTIAPQLHLFFAFIVGCESGVQVSSSPDGCSHAWRWPEAVHTSCGCPPSGALWRINQQRLLCALWGNLSRQWYIVCQCLQHRLVKLETRSNKEKEKKSRRAMTWAHCSSLTGLYMMLSCFTL